MAYDSIALFYRDIFSDLKVDDKKVERPEYISEEVWNKLSSVGKLLVGERF